jgi:hypothetical protein
MFSDAEELAVSIVEPLITFVAKLEQSRTRSRTYVSRHLCIQYYLTLRVECRILKLQNFLVTVILNIL